MCRRYIIDSDLTAVKDGLDEYICAGPALQVDHSGRTLSNENAFVHQINSCARVHIIIYAWMDSC